MTVLKQELADVDLPVTFLRPAWYIGKGVIQRVGRIDVKEAVAALARGA